MSIKESMLNIVSDLAQNDYIRAVTYGGYSRRVEVSELAKSVVEDYTGSSLAGENQSVQGAFSALENEIQNVEQDVTTEINDAILNILPTDTASGEIASFPDGSDLSPALSVVAGIDPIQDLHGYDAPWVGGAGKNKLQQSWTSPLTSNGVTFTRNSDGSVTATGGTNATQDAYCFAQFSLPVGNYYFTGCASGGSAAGTNGWNVYIWNGTTSARLKKWNGTTNADTNINTTTLAQVQVPNTTDSIYYVMRVMKGTTLPTNGITFYPMICASTETSPTYNPYENICPISGHDEVTVTVADDVDNPTVSEDYTTTLPSTTYGGTLDVVSGVLTVDRAMMDLGTQSWTYQSTWASWYTDYIADVKGTNTGTEIPNFISDRFEVVPTNEGMSPQAQGYTGISSTTRGSSGCRILVKNGSTTEPPIGQLVYELATPQTYQLTEAQGVELFKGYNNVWSDAGDMSVTYKADIQLYIDKQTNELRVAILALS